MLWWVLACNGPEPVSGPTCPPGDGEILRLETGEVGEDLDLMMRGTAGWVTLCLGPGSFPSNLEFNKTTEALPGQISWIGTEGSVITPELADSGAEPTPILLAMNQPLVFQGLRFEAPLDVYGSALTFRDVSFGNLALTAEDTSVLVARATESVDLEDLSISEVVVDNVVLYAEAPELRIDGLDFRDNRSVGGAHVQLTGATTIQGLVVEDTVALQNNPGSPLVSILGDGTVSDSALRWNQANGPALAASGRLDVDAVEIREHRSNWTGALTVYGSATLKGLTLHDNTSQEGALALYPLGPDSLVLVEDADLGIDEDENRPCDISIYGTCVLYDVAEVDSLLCDQTGCR